MIPLTSQSDKNILPPLFSSGTPDIPGVTISVVVSMYNSHRVMEDVTTSNQSYNLKVDLCHSNTLALI